MSELIILGMFRSVLYETRQAAAYWASKVHIFLSVDKVENLLFLFFPFFFFPFYRRKNTLVVFCSSFPPLPPLLPLFQTCQVSSKHARSLIYFSWFGLRFIESGARMDWWIRVCSAAGSPWQAGAWKQGLCTAVPARISANPYHGFFLKVKDFFEGVSFYVNKSHNKLLNSPNQTLCSSSCSTDLLCNFVPCSGHLLQHQTQKVMFIAVYLRAVSPLEPVRSFICRATGGL